LNFKTITDGLSKTIMVAETKEQAYSAWFDGTVNWVVAANTNSATAQYPQTYIAKLQPSSTTTTNNLVWLVNANNNVQAFNGTAGGSTSLNYGPSTPTAAGPFYIPNGSGSGGGTYPTSTVATAPAGVTSGANTATSWQWGPSSYHSGGAVIHLYADGAVRTVTDDVDPTLYVQLYTRAGNESVVLPGTE
jgi:hypothetical protein